MRIRIADKEDSRDRAPKNKCIVLLDENGEVVTSGGTPCNSSTRENKKYCPEHIEESPYMRRLLTKISEKTVEEEEVSRFGDKAVKPNSITVSEIITELSVKGPRSLEALAKAININTDILKKYINYLAQRHKVVLSKNKRKVTIISLPSHAKNPVAWLEDQDVYHESLEKRIHRLCLSDLTPYEISEYLNVPSSFVSQICGNRQNPICECDSEEETPHFSWCPASN